MNEAVETFRSVLLQNERPVWIRAPRNARTATRLTLFLDGELYRERVGAVSVIDGLADALADSWFVFVSTCNIDARWRECPCHRPFAGFIVEELLPWLSNRFLGLGGTRENVIAGLSYTGLAAAFIALEYPHAFQRVIAQSGSFWWNDGWLTKEFNRRPVSSTPAFYLDVGRRETQEYVQHRADVLQIVSQRDGVLGFRDALLERDVPVKYLEFDGGHEFAAWRQTLPGALEWALPRDCEGR